ncbi:hypothetical protein C5167_021005 [Papaver somniferum]|uniref:Uncharacterized protein n=1 Tax=Papaver somniferum TaxID=3469 RepID=A0A4Y7IYU2_PAPSO|nr:hypothetical protein C5167_021005 [Papaver somniferum]
MVCSLPIIQRLSTFDSSKLLQQSLFCSFSCASGVRSIGGGVPNNRGNIPLLCSPYNAISKHHTQGVKLAKWEDITRQDGNGQTLSTKQNMCKLDDANTVHMPIGFEVVFPSLIEMARSLDVAFSIEDSPALTDIYAKRNLKLARYWTEFGVCWARNSKVADMDDTAMGFRILRLHGRDVSPVSSYFETIAVAEEKSFVNEFANHTGYDNTRYLCRKKFVVKDPFILPSTGPRTKLKMVAKQKSFVNEFANRITGYDNIRLKRMRSVTKKTTMNRDIKDGKEFGENHFHEEQQQQLIMALVSTLPHLSLDVLVSHGIDIRGHLRNLWEIFLKQGYDKQKIQLEEAFVLVRTINLCAGLSAKLLEKKAILSNAHLTCLVSLTNSLTHELLQLNGEAKVDKEMVSVELGMQELATIDHHIAKITRAMMARDFCGSGIAAGLVPGGGGDLV